MVQSLPPITILYMRRDHSIQVILQMVGFLFLLFSLICAFIAFICEIFNSCVFILGVMFKVASYGSCRSAHRQNSFSFQKGLHL